MKKVLSFMVLSFMVFAFTGCESELEKFEKEQRIKEMQKQKEQDELRKKIME